jgi:ribonuclease VapC
VILDTSAIVTLMRREPGYERIAEIIATHPVRFISAGTWLELWIVVQRSRQPELAKAVTRFLDQFTLTIEPVTEAQANIARDAYDRFGRGTGHPAKLNFGDCFAYALAREKNEPLLFVGDDFTHTDIQSALEL